MKYSSANRWSCASMKSFMYFLIFTAVKFCFGDCCFFFTLHFYVIISFCKLVLIHHYSAEVCVAKSCTFCSFFVWQVLVEGNSHVRKVLLNRPKQLNALSFQMVWQWLLDYYLLFDLFILFLLVELFKGHLLLTRVRPLGMHPNPRFAPDIVPESM